MGVDLVPACLSRALVHVSSVQPFHLLSAGERMLVTPAVWILVQRVLGCRWLVGSATAAVTSMIHKAGKKEAEAGNPSTRSLDVLLSVLCAYRLSTLRSAELQEDSAGQIILLRSVLTELLLQFD